MTTPIGSSATGARWWAAPAQVGRGDERPATID